MKSWDKKKRTKVLSITVFGAVSIGMFCLTEVLLKHGFRLIDACLFTSFALATLGSIQVEKHVQNKLIKELAMLGCYVVTWTAVSWIFGGKFDWSYSLPVPITLYFANYCRRLRREWKEEREMGSRAFIPQSKFEL